jgi:DNA-binding MarR family transcriptional regulator
MRKILQVIRPKKTAPHPNEWLLERARGILFKHTEQGCTARELQQRLHIANTEAQQCISDLFSMGHIHSSRRGRAIIYKLTAIGRQAKRQLHQPKIYKERAVTSGMRFQILKRDGYRCQVCGKTSQDNVRLEVDHKVARSLGGTNNFSNLWTLCDICNTGKHTDGL